MPSAQPSLIGATIGNYRVGSKLGEGGMGTVYLAEHPLIGKRVALKVLHPEMAHNPDLVTRFFNEARAVNEIGHPNIVDVVDYGVLEQEGRQAVVYFIMELLQGEPLSALLRREAPLPAERALRIAVQIADALAASHGKGVIHRDLKPDNVFLTQRGRESDFVKVLDFGIAKLTPGSAGGEISRTRTGVVMGTPAYMSPEQCEGKRGVDNRTDCYSLGVLLFEMVTGRVPFLGEGYGEVILQHMTQPPPAPSSIAGGVPRAVEAVIMKALEKKRERRFGSMEQMVAALRDPERFLEDEVPYTDPPSKRAVTVPEVPERKSRVADAFRETLDAPSSTTLSSSAAELGVTQRRRARAPVIAISATIVLGLLTAGGLALVRRTEDPPLMPVARPAEPEPAPPQPAASAADAMTAAVVPAPLEPQTVSVNVTSAPPGADVLVDGAVRGQTPLVMHLPRADGAIELVLRLEGYRDKSKVVRTSRDSELEVMLEKAPRRKRREPAPGAEEPPKGPKPAGDEEILPPTF